LYRGTDRTDVLTGQFSHGFLFVDFDQYEAGMAFSADEMERFAPILTDTLHTLDRRGLISKFASGGPEYLRTYVAGRAFPERGGIIFNLTQFGVLFLVAACGVSGDVGDAWVGEPSAFAMEAGPAIPTIVSAHDLPQWVDPVSRAPVD
jgi:hypothetical protein